MARVTGNIPGLFLKKFFFKMDIKNEFNNFIQELAKFLKFNRIVKFLSKNKRILDIIMCLFTFFSPFFIVYQTGNHWFLLLFILTTPISFCYYVISYFK